MAASSGDQLGGSLALLRLVEQGETQGLTQASTVRIGSTEILTSGSTLAKEPQPAVAQVVARSQEKPRPQRSVFLAL